MSLTLFDKIWNKHVVHEVESGMDVLFIDRHFIHEVTSPQAFDGLRKRTIPVAFPDLTIATADHNVPTKNQHLPIVELLSRLQVEALTQNCNEFGVELYGLGHPFQGIVHVIGPELGITLPGLTIVCGDSHTSTHGAFGSIAFGIGTSEVEQVLATQTLIQKKPKQMRIHIDGELPAGVTAKDVILYILARITSSGATGHFIEYCGSTIRNLSMEARMTICNMSIELGARGGFIAPDQKTFDYIKEKLFAPQGTQYLEAENEWKELYSDKGAKFDKELYFRVEDIEPMITFGTNPGMGMKISQRTPSSNKMDSGQVENYRKSLQYMGIEENQTLEGLPVNYVFIGSCTNARIEDLRAAANLIQGRKKAENVHAFLVPGSTQVRKQAELEGLSQIFKEAGFEFREPGCSACLGMNEDKIPKGEYCVSTSNRNFEGRQGVGARTILASPLTAIATALTGKLTDARTLFN